MLAVARIDPLGREAQVVVAADRVARRGQRRERPSLRGERWWRVRATTSLPTPLSPHTSTVRSVAATCSTILSTAHMGALFRKGWSPSSPFRFPAGLGRGGASSPARARIDTPDPFVDGSGRDPVCPIESAPLPTNIA
jgi:hypothetical protein